MTENGFEVLRYRVAHLDRSAPEETYFKGALEDRLDPDVSWFAEVLGSHDRWTDTTDPATGQPIPSGIEPHEADAIVGECALIQRLRKQAPQVMDGPVDLMAQQWVRNQPDQLPDGTEIPSAEHFVPVTAATVISPGVKPWYVGFFTSTGVWRRPSMWRVYQDEFSSMYPLPLPTWQMHVEPDAAVHEIRSAVDWARFVERYPKVVDNRVYPDWPAVAKDWDAVHFTASALASAQGLVFLLGTDEVQPLMLDVEQTFWLSWRFTGATLLAPGPLDTRR